MLNTKRNVLGSVIALLLSGAIIAFSVWLFFNRQFVVDQFNVWSYEPSASVAAIEERAQLTDKGRFMFYATKPEVLEAATFNTECPRQEVGNPILGCYTSADRIFIYNLTDAQLDGMKEVTAAHEMLHAAWVRIDEDEKARITTLIREAYEKVDNPELTTRMEYYERTEPGEYINELHSILGTEVAELGPELESYYAQYYDRTNILALHDIYGAFYSGLTQQAENLFSQMESLAASIDAKSKTYDQEVGQLTSDINSFNARANANSFTSTAQFNNERAALIRRSNQLEAQRASINNDISVYNGYYEQYQQIAGQLQILNESMDSYKSLDETPSV